MKKLDLGYWMALVANVGVIIGIAFLAIEIRDNTTTARVSATLEVAAQLASLNFSLASDTAITAVYLKGIEDFQSLSPLEREQFDRVMRAYLVTLSGVMRDS